jgi:hypothetical protein
MIGWRARVYQQYDSALSVTCHTKRGNSGTRRSPGCYRPRYLNIQRLNYLWTIRHSSARIAGNLIT